MTTQDALRVQEGKRLAAAAYARLTPTQQAAAAAVPAEMVRRLRLSYASPGGKGGRCTWYLATEEEDTAWRATQ